MTTIGKCPVRGCRENLDIGTTRGQEQWIDSHLAAKHPRTAAGRAAIRRNQQRLATGRAD